MFLTFRINARLPKRTSKGGGEVDFVVVVFVIFCLGHRTIAKLFDNEGLSLEVRIPTWSPGALVGIYPIYLVLLVLICVCLFAFVFALLFFRCWFFFFFF